MANDYCRKFAEAGKIKLSSTSLVKLTKTQINEITKAAGYGLSSKYVNEKAVYQVNSSGEPTDFKGFDGERSAGGPCITCSVHTKEAWEKYKKDNKLPSDDKNDKDKNDKDKNDQDKTDQETTKPTEKPSETKPKPTKENGAAAANVGGGWLTDLAELFQ